MQINEVDPVMVAFVRQASFAAIDTAVRSFEVDEYLIEDEVELPTLVPHWRTDTLFSATSKAVLVLSNAAFHVELQPVFQNFCEYFVGQKRE